MAIEKAAYDNPIMRNEMTDSTKGGSILSAANERAEFIRAVIVGLEDLEADRELSFDKAAIRLGVDQSEGRL
ncbi:MAG: hypothetical protein J5I81_13785 [Nitrococcus mobilis]|nr:hypothetical protein [Nitrococcus mobilis]